MLSYYPFINLYPEINTIFGAVHLHKLICGVVYRNKLICGVAFFNKGCLGLLIFTTSYSLTKKINVT